MIITIQCSDRVGLVAKISGVMERHEINIISMREHVDTEENIFFARIQIQQTANKSAIAKALKEVLPEGAAISVNPITEKKVVIFVSKEYHALSELLIRNHFNTLLAKVECVIGNHANLEEFCTRLGIPFYHVSHEGKSKQDFEKQVLEIVNQYKPHYLVLAKFMRILSPSFISKFPYRIINIHHSFLPAFIGANPYLRAYERGVKIIGATAHFVTNDLDEGPIIEQQIIRINHTYSANDMRKAGKEIEKATLAKALQLVLENKVFVYKNKTVVF